ncbi:MAG: hypothetical protein IIT61_05255, partial [Bacteroidales bacterium]|nr:hypothetical protein [Bacteroidales bacterium]
KERQAFLEEKMQTLEDMKDNNPNVEKLVSNMGLEISEDFLTFPPNKTSEDILFDKTNVPL